MRIFTWTEGPRSKTIDLDHVIAHEFNADGIGMGDMEAVVVLTCKLRDEPIYLFGPDNYSKENERRVREEYQRFCRAWENHPI